MSSVAVHYGAQRQHVKGWLRAAGIELKSHLQAAREANARDASKYPGDEVIKDLYVTRGLTVEEMRGVLRCGQETVYSWISRAGLTPRTLGESVSAGHSERTERRIEELGDVSVLMEQHGSRQVAQRAAGVGRILLDKAARLQGYELPASTRSVAEAELFDHLRSIDPEGGWEKSDRTICPPFELDMVSHRRGMAVEYCGLYWHSEVSGEKWPRYHLEKLEACEARGYRLITVFEGDDPAKVRMTLAAKLGIGVRFIGARDCEVVVLDRSEARAFEEEHHLAGTTGASTSVGLAYGDSLVSVMSLVRPRFSSRHDREVSRYTCRHDISVAGGCSRLFRAAVRETGATSVVTYADRRFGTGGCYLAAGFTRLKPSGPNYWYHRRAGRLWSRVVFQKHKLQEELGELFNPTLTEWQNMRAAGWDRIWDCGSHVYEWRE